MGALIAGVLLWSAAHLMKSLAQGVRTGLQNSIGAGPHKGLVALLILSGLGLIIYGWRSSVPEFVYDAPNWGRHLNMTLMLVALYLLGAANGPFRIKRIIRHPMLTGVAVWAVGHLLANGDTRSLVLFGGLGAWAIISIVTVSAREGRWVKPAKVVPAYREAILVVITLVLYGLITWAHPWIAGVPVIGTV